MVIFIAAAWSQPVAGKRGQKDLLAVAQLSQQRHQFGREVLNPSLVRNDQRAVHMVFARGVSRREVLDPTRPTN
jgi:hypothetical protein